MGPLSCLTASREGNRALLISKDMRAHAHTHARQRDNDDGTLHGPPGGCGRAGRYLTSLRLPPCPETRSGKKPSLLTEPLAAQVYPRQWEVMLRLQATSAGHTWDSAAPTLVLLIQPGVCSVHSNSGGFTGSSALPAKSFQTFHPLWVSLKSYLKPQSRLVNPRTQMPAPKSSDVFSGQTEPGNLSL